MPFPSLRPQDSYGYDYLRGMSSVIMVILLLFFPDSLKKFTKKKIVDCSKNYKMVTICPNNMILVMNEQRNFKENK